MIFDLTAIFLLLAGTPAILLIMFLPAFLELQRPRDIGPRMIAPGFNKEFSGLSSTEIPNLESEFQYDRALILLMERAMAIFPSLDS